ncbi:MAG: ABC transporter ATP-binding protein [Isosphaeraceae bacterium]
MLFELRNLSKSYGRVVALDDLTVSVPEGAIGLLGPNGAGKTTMIRSLMGLIRVDSGSGHVLGRDVRRAPLDVRQVVGFVPEDECLFPGVDGVEFVAYSGELAGMGRSDALQRAHEMLDYTGLGEARYRKVESYSTGMKQRLKIASAIVHDPRMVILDEPTNGMDPAGRLEILELARDLTRRKGMSLLFSSHLMPDVEAVCDHVLVMGRGRLLAQGTLADLTRTERPAFEVRVKGDQAAFGARLSTLGCQVESTDDALLVETPAGRSHELLWSIARDAGEQIRMLRPLRNSLEEVFLKAVAELN